MRKAFHSEAAILRRLDIDRAEVQAAPKVTEIIVRCMGDKSGRFPREQVLNYLAASDSPAAVRFLKSYRELKTDAGRLSLEAICVHAHVSPLEVLGAVLMAAKSLKATESALKAILAHPDVVDATVRQAVDGTPLLKSDGRTPYLDEKGRPVLIGHGDVAAKKLLHEAIGFLPTRKGGGVEINFFGKPHESPDDEPDDDEKAFDACFVDNAISGKLDRWSEDRRALTDGK